MAAALKWSAEFPRYVISVSLAGFAFEANVQAVVWTV